MARIAAAHHGSHAAAAIEFMNAAPYDSIIPENAKTTPDRNAPCSERSSARPSLRAPKNAQRT
jgi:hypothetical protein